MGGGLFVFEYRRLKYTSTSAISPIDVAVVAADDDDEPIANGSLPLEPIYILNKSRKKRYSINRKEKESIIFSHWEDVHLDPSSFSIKQNRTMLNFSLSLFLSLSHTILLFHRQINT